MIDFTSRQLRGFLLVAQHRSFSRAAGALFITPSGLSLLIRELENQLGVRLFERTTRNVALTAFGTELLTVAQRNLQELDAVMSRIGQSVSETGGYLSVGTPPLLMASVLAPAIQEFRSHRPNSGFSCSIVTLLVLCRRFSRAHSIWAWAFFSSTYPAS